MKTLNSIAALALLVAGCFAAPSADARGFASEPPAWAASLRHGDAKCTTAADKARQRAIAQGISPSRMQWLYGRKPFEKIGHVSLVIDGWIVVDNGGLGRNLWGDSICRGNVCTLKDARRGLEESFLESATVAVREEIPQGDWSMHIAASAED